jgi:hypothetical protein
MEMIWNGSAHEAASSSKLYHKRRNRAKFAGSEAARNGSTIGRGGKSKFAHARRAAV